MPSHHAHHSPRVPWLHPGSSRRSYEQYAQLLLPPILNRMPEAEQVLSLLGELRDQHGTNIQFLLLKNNLFPAILGFLTAPQRSLHLGNVSLIR